MAKCEEQLKQQRSIAAESQRQAEMLRIQNEMLMKQVKQMNAVQMQIQEFISRFPLAPNEVERVYSVEELKLEELDDIPEIDEVLEGMLLKGRKKLGVRFVMLNVMHSMTQTTVSFRGLHPMDNQVMGRGSEDPMKFSKRMSRCQYVVSEGGVVCYKPNAQKGDELNFMRTEFWSKYGDILKTTDEDIRSTADGFSDPHFALLDELYSSIDTADTANDLSGLTKFREEKLEAGVSMNVIRILEAQYHLMNYSRRPIYIGAPVFLQGKCVAVLCVYLDPLFAGVEELEAQGVLNMENDELGKALDLDGQSDIISKLIEKKARSPSHQQKLKIDNPLAAS